MIQPSPAVDVDDFSSAVETLPHLRFGKYPEQREVEALEAAGVGLFIDLTCASEGLPGYGLSSGSVRFHYPIEDRRVPASLEETKVPVSATTLALREGKSVYVHCRGGHGRAALFSACVLSMFYVTAADKGEAEAAKMALADVAHAHQARKVMKPRWRKLGAPQTRPQKDFVRTFARAVAVTKRE